MWYLLIGLGIFISYIFWISSRPKNFPPGPPCLPFVGCLPFINVKKQPLYHLALEETGKKWGFNKGIMGLRLGTNLTIAIWNPALVREVLHRDEFQGRPDGFVFRLRTFGKRLGLFFGVGPHWVEQRRFSLRQLRDLGILGLYKVQDVVHSEVVELLRHIRSHPKGTLEGSWLLQGNALFTVHIVNILWALMSGQRLSRDDAELQHLLLLLTRLFRNGQISSGYLNALPFLRFIAPKMSGYAEQKETLDILQGFIGKVIEEHKSTFNENNIRDFIDSYLLEMKEHASEKDPSFTDEQLISICTDFFSAGSESVGNTLSFALLYLALHPDVQVRIWKEMEKEIGEASCPSLEDRARLPYLEAVLLEVIRVNSIAPMAVPHTAIKDTVLAGYSVPKGTWLHLSLWSINHDPCKWPEPDEFRPERFINKDGQVIRDDAMLPFGAGKRVCVGMSFAKSGLFLFLAGLVANFEFRLVPGDPLPSLVSLPGFTTAPRPFRILAVERKKVSR